MFENNQENISEERKALAYDNGKIYFSRETERKFYFVLTIIMLISGIIFKSGLF